MPLPEISPAALRLSMGVPLAGLGGLLGYAAAPKEHKLDNMARQAGIGYMTGSGAGLGSTLADIAVGETSPYRVPAMVVGALGGGALGWGAGKMLAGEPEWERKQKFREELLGLLREEATKLNDRARNKLAAKQALETVGLPMAPAPIPTPPSPLEGLLKAKELSDSKNYRGKHTQLRNLISRYPDDFYIDSEDNGIVGITHAPTGFRIHAPRRVLPVPLRKRKPALVQP